MTLSRTILQKRGALNISPAVRPSPEAISSSAGMADAPSDMTGKFQRVDANTAVANADGEAIVTFFGPPPGYKWNIERASVGSVTGGFDHCQVHVGGFNLASQFETLVDTTDVPNRDIADESSPIFVGPEQNVIFRFIGGAEGDDATARIQYTEEPV